MDPAGRGGRPGYIARLLRSRPWFHCSWRGCSLARSVLGADYDAGDYAVFAGRNAYGILATVCGDGSWEPSKT